MWVLRLRPWIYRPLYNISSCGPVNILQDSNHILSVRNTQASNINPVRYCHGNKIGVRNDFSYLSIKMVTILLFQPPGTLQDDPESNLPSHIGQTIINLRDIDKSAGESQNLLKTLETAKDELSLEELVFGLFYLSRHPHDPPSLYPLVQYSLERTRNGEELNLPSISRLSATLNALIHELPNFYTYPIVIPRISEQLHRQDLTEEELIHLTAAMKQTMR